jgi:hypothetical protein
MALKKTTKTHQGFDAIDAYHRVENLSLINKTRMFFQVKSYKDNEGLPSFSDVAYESVYNLQGPNPIAQAYAHLKTLPEFLEATDC